MYTRVYDRHYAADVCAIDTCVCVCVCMCVCVCVYLGHMDLHTAVIYARE